VVLDLAGEDALGRDLAAGGVFVAGYAAELMAECDLVVRVAGDELVLAARVVFVDARGIGLELVDRGPEIKEQLAALIALGAGLDDDLVTDHFEALEPEDDLVTSNFASVAEPDEAKRTPHLHERLRGLTLAQQIKRAKHAEVSERIVLERIYGKTVWDPLLRNPRITAPEVARIARMGALPRPLIELICTNGTWLQVPEVRRALLSNPRLGVDQILRVLRLLPKHELKLAASTTSYSHPVRDAAKRLLRELG
jgi:hypothetical protein